VLALAALGLFLYSVLAGSELEFYYPFHAKGKTALWIVFGAFIIWLLIAAFNWRSWFKTQKRNNQTNAARDMS
jgi:hypothetical protein